MAPQVKGNPAALVTNQANQSTLPTPYYKFQQQRNIWDGGSLREPYAQRQTATARVDKTLSSPRPIRSGLPQGSLSSPLLFTLYVNDMPQTDLSHLAMFADDTAIITQNKRFSVVISNLQHYVSLLELWLTDWKIKVNASKSACLMFTRRPRLPVGLTPVQIFGQPVPWVRVAKYLGLFLDAKLTFAHHIEQTRKKRRLFMPFSNGLSPEGVNLRSGIRFCSINL
ncbi:hypothetical protein TNCV_1194371 [Trichonephila clavipes]|nr:hypothetical protein TNCV_1194371 [Trichonephila clavipes]